MPPKPTPPRKAHPRPTADSIQTTTWWARAHPTEPSMFGYYFSLALRSFKRYHENWELAERLVK